MSIVNENKNVPFNTIEIPDEENARVELEKIPELAENIKVHGLLQGFTCSVDAKGKLRLVAGFRRAAALKLLKWGDKMVPVTIVSLQGRAIKNLVENVQRNDLKTADLAQRLHDLSTGDYPREKGELAVKYSKEMLAAQVGLSIPQVTNLIRAHANLADSLKKSWQKHDLPQNLVFKCAAMTTKEEQVVELKDERGKALKDDEGNVKTKTVKITVPDEKAQEKLLARWTKAKEIEALAQKGEKKEKPVSGGEGGEGGEEAEDGGAVHKDGQRPGKKQLAEFIEKATTKLKEYEANTLEHAKLSGKLDAVKWAAGIRDALAPR